MTKNIQSFIIIIICKLKLDNFEFECNICAQK